MPKKSPSPWPLPRKRWLRVEEAAEYTRTSVNFIWTLIHSGAIKPVKPGKRYVVDRLDLDAHLEKMKREQNQ